MPSVKVYKLIDRAAGTLQDEDNTRWTRADLNDWLNEGQRVAVALKPDANSVNMSVLLIGGTKQQLPDDGVSLIKITRNMGADGSTPGRVISIVDQQSIDTLNPDWHTDAASATVQNYVYDEQDPKNFYVYPPQPSAGNGYIELVYGSLPTDVADDKEDAKINTISLGDEYESVLLNYMLFRAYAEEGDSPAGASKAGAYWDLFLQALGVKEAKEVQFDPNIDIIKR